jgi:GLPGLI family protein
MKSNLLIKALVTSIIILFSVNVKNDKENNEFQGKAYYMSKSTMSLGNFGARFSEAQKKQIMARLKGRLEKKFILTFNKQESMFVEEEKLDAVSGATDSWGKNFAQGDQYKNVKDNMQIQNQEFYGKNFLVKDNLQPIKWNMLGETKKIGNYICYKATATIPTNQLTWYSFSWDRISNNSKDKETKMTTVEAWYTPQIPVSHGPSEYWGLPGLILEVSAGDTTLLCYELVLNPKEKTKIKAPKKGKVVTKNEYQSIITKKMKEFRENRMGRR